MTFPQALTVLLIVSSSASDGDNFQQFMECLFGGDVSEEDISGALEGAVTLLPLNKKLGTVLHHYTIREVLLAPQLPAGVVLPMMAVLPRGGSTGDSDETEQSSEDQDDGSGSDSDTSGQEDE